jgi:DNA-binding transcriptional regulator YhcF (GntR family)
LGGTGSSTFLTISRNSGQPLADQIVTGIKRQIDDRHLRSGTKLPSIRNFAESYKVSRSTVVEAYDRLVAMGCLQSRRDWLLHCRRAHRCRDDARSVR